MMAHPLDPGPAYDPETRAERKARECDEFNDAFRAFLDEEARVFVEAVIEKAKKKSVDIDLSDVAASAKYSKAKDILGVISEYVADALEQFFELEHPEDYLSGRIG